MNIEKRLFRETNILRVVGIILVLVGGYLPQAAFSGLGFTGSTNLIQLLGLGLVFYPFLKELILRRQAP